MLQYDLLLVRKFMYIWLSYVLIIVNCIVALVG